MKKNTQQGRLQEFRVELGIRQREKAFFFLYPAEVLFAPYFLSPRLVGDKFSRY